MFLRAAGLALVVLASGCAQPEPEAIDRPALVTQAIGGATGVEAYSGEIHAREEPPLAFRIGGKLARRLVDAGAHVEAGQALAELDPSDVALQAEGVRAQLASAQSDLALAQSELDRYKNLADRQLVSQSLFDSRVAAHAAAQARVRQARAQSSASGNQIAYATLRAPRAGVITQRLAEAGQVLAAGQPVFVLAVDGEREVSISVPEGKVGEFAVGRELAVESWAAPGRRFAGRLREISPAADPQTRTFAARVSFDSDSVTTQLGQSARVYASRSGSAKPEVPLSALTQRSGRPAVWVVDPQTRKVSLRRVTVGAYREDGVPVLTGLTGNEWVVAAGAHLIQDGERVLPIDRNNRPIRLGAGKIASSDNAAPAR